MILRFEVVFDLDFRWETKFWIRLLGWYQKSRLWIVLTRLWAPLYYYDHYEIQKIFLVYSIHDFDFWSFSNTVLVTISHIVYYHDHDEILNIKVLGAITLGILPWSWRNSLLSLLDYLYHYDAKVRLKYKGFGHIFTSWYITMIMTKFFVLQNWFESTSSIFHH